ncbi:MAG TPA: hypothetical protein H9667_06590 [Firmicutes bacterium]|nr:hypothetical protein [Bacillota bacterium]
MLNNLLIEVESNRVIRVPLFENCDLEELLDMRDDEEFDSEWMRVYDALNEFEIGDFEKKKIDNIREKSFLKSYNLSGLGDIASCVSDDFEIICKAYLTNYNDMWVNSLIMSYVNGKFPCGRLEKTEYDIKECMKKLCKK